MAAIAPRNPVQRGCFTDKYEVRKKIGKGAQVLSRVDCAYTGHCS
jgi:hypothetical protein